MVKRESELIVPSGMPVASNVNIPSGLVSSLISEDESGIRQIAKEKPNDRIFYSELVMFISKHFIDDRIANPDLKEIYLVRLNILLQHNQFIKLFEQQDYAQEHLIIMLMKSFGRNINLRHVTKNILRLAKG